jgi:hypothetical protein
MAALLACVAATVAHAGGPRFVSGSVGYASAGTAMAFYTSQPLYFTDPGDLSATVTHAQADAMVAAAAAVWNVPPTALILQQGGTLAEHVSGANSYVSGSSIAFPADVQSSNYRSIPIAIVYDTDGSVTDLLLGQGASEPSGCLQNAVTESVDAFAYDMAIDHAVIILNGRCIDSATERPQQLLQMQYQLTRGFGRALGLSWSQLNDYVFTGDPAPTLIQAENWPLMHPIDVLCGPYTYLCMQEPFTLRRDDISALAYLYPDFTFSPPAGKQSTQLDNIYIFGNLNFATGQQAELVNMTAEVWYASSSTGFQNWQIVSAVTGFQFQENGGNPVTGIEPDALNAGAYYTPAEGSYFMPAIPVGSIFANVRIQTESVNPLYIGEHAVGAYQRPVISMPGTVATSYGWTLSYYQTTDAIPVALVGAPSSCNTGNDGVEAAPAAPDPSGWQNGLLCGVGHTSWFTTTIRANHTWTLEATALDDTGEPTINNAQPVLGVWNITDATGTLPSIAATSSAMNSLSFGMTQLHVPSEDADTTVRLTVADQYGAGRPDFAYKLRILYADSIAPTTVPITGGQITITGMGFQRGNTVTVNGVAATVLTSTANQIVVLTPTQAAAGAGSDPVDIIVTDTSTGGTTDISSTLTFAGLPPPPVNVVTIATPAAYLAAGAGAQWTVALTATQNGLPAIATPVTWTATAGLTLTTAQTSTNATGTATVVAKITAIAAASSYTVTACAWTTVCATWTVSGVAASEWVIAPTSGAAQTVHATQTAAPVVLQVTDTAGHALPGASVTLYQTVYAWEGACPAARCPSAPVLASSQTSMISDASGQVTLTPLQRPNIPQTIAIAAATGLYGFATTTVAVEP